MEVDVKAVAEEFLQQKARGGYRLDAGARWLAWVIGLAGLWVVTLLWGR